MSETNIHIHPGSILDVRADAIVNPANSFLDHKGGLARVIAEAATRPFHEWRLKNGSGLCVAALRTARDGHNERVNAWVLDHQNAPLIATGNAYHTSPGALPFKGVVHAVGPIWNGGEFSEHLLLLNAHGSVLRICQEQGYTSVAFPAIACGVFGFPVESAAKLAVDAASWGTTYGVTDVTFALTDDAHVAAYHAALESVKS